MPRVVEFTCWAASATFHADLQLYLNDQIRVLMVSMRHNIIYRISF